MVLGQQYLLLPMDDEDDVNGRRSGVVARRLARTRREEVWPNSCFNTSLWVHCCHAFHRFRRFFIFAVVFVLLSFGMLRACPFSAEAETLRESGAGP